MQKRTRIFAAITVAIGLLLGLGMFATTFFSTAVPAGAAAAKKHHKGGHTTTVTTTNTSTTTVVVTPAPPPGPTCFVTPNNIPLTSGNVNFTPPFHGSAKFDYDCSNLNPTHSYVVVTNLPSGCFGAPGLPPVISLGPGTQISGTVYTTFPQNPDLDGHLYTSFEVYGCVPGTYNISLFDLTTGVTVSSNTVTLLAPQPAKKH